MSRIRTIKPEFFTSESILTISHSARLTFIGLWTHVDDAGRARDDPRIIKGAIWPIEDEITWKDIAAHLDELAEAVLICRYDHGGKHYLHVVTWQEHQAIQKPSKPRHPECPRETHGGDPPSSGNPPVGPPEGSSSPPEIPVAGSRKGKRDLGKTSVESDKPTRPRAPTAAEQDRAVFEAWQEATGKHRARLDDKRRRAIRNARKHYHQDDLLDAVRGVAKSPFHCGQNPQGRRYDELTLILRDAEHLEHFRDLWRGVADERAPILPRPDLRIVPDEEPPPQLGRPSYGR